MSIHINWTKPGHYRGYIRGHGCRNFKRVTGRCKTPERALALAVAKMDQGDKRAAAFFCEDELGWYEPVMVMEAKRI